MTRTELIAGIDIGGTKLAWCLGTTDGELVARGQQPTRKDAAPEILIDEALGGLRSLWGDRPGAPVALGFACPGPMSGAEGRFLDPPNMPRWHDFALLDHLARSPQQIGENAVRKIPATMMNDANATALAEWRWGAARGHSTVIYLTMSTGMGAGLVIDGRLFQGPDELAGEIGHLRLTDEGPVGFGKRGSVEGWLSGPGMTQVARAEALVAQQRGEASALLSDGVVRPDLDPHQLCLAASAGDKAALRATGRIGHALGRLSALLTDLLNPEIIVVGTIGAAWPDLFLPPARHTLEIESIPRARKRVRLVPAALGDQRGPLSALAAALHSGER
ncbi:MAG: ROK family protein [Bradymonadia bacterium]